MSTSPTKSLRVRLSSALRAGFKERGWGKKTLGFSMDLAPQGWVEASFDLLLSKEVDSAKFGGVSLYAFATIWSSRVAEVIKTMPPGCLDEVTEGAVSEGTELATLAWVELDALTSSDWTAIQEADLDAEVAEFFRTVEGPLRSWAAERDTAERLLAVQAVPGAREAQQPADVRTMAVLAVQEELVDVARGLVAGYVPNGRSDTEERFARFEVELAKRLPAYGAPTRS